MKESVGPDAIRVKSRVGFGGMHSGLRLFLLGVLLVSLIILWAAAPVFAATPASFDPAVNYTAGTSPRGTTAADLNGDGILDLVVSNAGGNNVSIMLGNGDGTFGAATNFAATSVVESYPASVAAADFNGDGKIDLAVTTQFPDGVSILLGNGDGTVGAPVSIAAGAYPYGIIASDFNADGKIDLVVTNYNTSKKITVMLGNGDGTFAAPVSYAFAGLYPTGLAMADFNADGKTDLAVANNNSGTVAVIKGNGDGTFSQGAAADNYGIYPVGAIPRSVTTGDFNGDGKIDLAVSNASGNAGGTVSILLGNGDMTFKPAVNYTVVPPTGANLRSIATADFNGDGKLDLVVANKTATNNILVLLGNGDGTFGAAVSYTGGSNPDGPQSVITGDFNGDGKPDIGVANYTSGNVSILLNTTPSPCTPTKPSLGVANRYAYWASYSDYLARELSVKLVVSNTGADTAYGVAITGSSNIPSSVTLSTPTNIAIGDLTGGASSEITVQYYVPVGVGKFYANVTGSASDVCGTSYTYPV